MVQFQWMAADVPAFEAGSPHACAHSLDDEVALKPVSYTHLDVYKRQLFQLRLDSGQWLRAANRSFAFSGRRNHRFPDGLHWHHQRDV